MLQPSRWFVRCRSTERSPASSMRDPGRASIEGSSAPCFSHAALSATWRACNLTSDALVATTSPGSTSRSIPRGWLPGLVLTSRSSKTRGSVGTRAPFFDEYFLFPALFASTSACALVEAEGRGVFESPPPYPRLCRRRPASSVAFTARRVPPGMNPALRHAARFEPLQQELRSPAGVEEATASGSDLASSVHPKTPKDAESDASRRFLQSRQPTSTTTNRPDPRSAVGS